MIISQLNSCSFCCSRCLPFCCCLGNEKKLLYYFPFLFCFPPNELPPFPYIYSTECKCFTSQFRAFKYYSIENNWRYPVICLMLVCVCVWVSRSFVSSIFFFRSSCSFRDIDSMLLKETRLCNTIFNRKNGASSYSSFACFPSFDEIILSV